MRTIEAFLSRKPPNMTDKQTLQWWIDHANELEAKLNALRQYSEARDERIVTAVLERNTAYDERDHWKKIAEAYITKSD